MICRLWKGWIPREKAARYQAHLTEELFPRLHESLGDKGYRGYHVLAREPGADADRVTEFVTLLWFDSLESVKLFAGPSLEDAVIDNGAASLVGRHWPRVEHYELRAASRLGSADRAAGRRTGREARLRTHRPGDLGWILYRHGVLYTQEYGWNQHFESLVAEVAAQFLRSAHPDQERCWVAELEDEIVGAIMLTRKTDEVGQLRLLYVEPHARGHGVGDRLVQTCIDAARDAGYKSLTLFTTNVLLAVRKIYERKGFRLVRAEPHYDFGPALLGETWTLALDP